MSTTSEQAADFLRKRLSQDEINKRIDRIEAESGRYLRVVLDKWAAESKSPSVLMAVAARLMSVVMVMGDASVTEFEMQGGVLDDSAIVEMVGHTAKAYAMAVREDMSEGQRVN